MRIASLLPSCTEIACALGLADDVVGISHECDFPEEVKNKLVLTKSKINSSGNSFQINKDVAKIVMQGVSVYDINEEKLRELKPDIVLTQDQCDVCAVSLKDVQKAVKNMFGAEIISLKPEVLSDIFLDIKKVAFATNREKESRKLLNQLYSRVDYIRTKTRYVFRPKVCIIEWISPLMVAGNWVPEMIEIAGGTNIIGEHGKHSKKMVLETVFEHQPDKIVVVPCGFKIPQTIDNLAYLTSQNEWHKLNAVKNNEVYIVDGNAYFNRPSQRVVDSLEILASIIHPELFFEKREYGFRVN